MKYSISYILISLVFFFQVVFAQEREEQRVDYPSTTRKAIKKYEFKEGRYTDELAMDNGEKWKVRFSVPEINKEKEIPLIIALHWAGNENSFFEYSECLAFPSFESLNGIILAPSDGGMHWLEEENEYRIIKLIRQILRFWPIDKKKVIVTGYSNGAIGAWQYSYKHSNLFAAALPIAGYYDKPIKTEVPIYALHGGKDELFDSKIVEDTWKKSINKKSKITYKILPDYSHFMGCYYTEELKKMVSKMQKEVLEKE